MSRGKHLSLEEARKADQIDQFARELPSVGDEATFDQLLNRMAKVAHKSDCAVHNAPAMKPGPCDCGAATDKQ